jgi:two-component system chemotaxis response regulator CheY
MKGLVVDSSATMRRIFANALRGLGCDEVVEAVDGKQALDLCDRDTAILVTTWKLVGMGGTDMVRDLRANPETAHVRILMVTARNLKRDVLEAHEAGVNAYLLRPFTAEALRHRLMELTPQAGSETTDADGGNASATDSAAATNAVTGESTAEAA